MKAKSHTFSVIYHRGSCRETLVNTRQVACWRSRDGHRSLMRYIVYGRLASARQDGRKRGNRFYITDIYFNIHSSLRTV